MKDESKVYGSISQARSGVLSDILKQTAANLDDLIVVRKPHRVRVMMRLRDSVDAAPFNLGDVLATEAEVEWQGCRSAMLVLGDEPDRALLGAVAMAVWRKVPEASPIFTAALEKENAMRQQQADQIWAAVATSRVDFEGGAIEAYSAADRTKGR